MQLLKMQKARVTDACESTILGRHRVRFAVLLHFSCGFHFPQPALTFGCLLRLAAGITILNVAFRSEFCAPITGRAQISVARQSNAGINNPPNLWHLSLS
jgi:hypothetical protein